ncbi:MAG: helix-turn-helix transcriptional regulator [Nitrospirae bacterium]|nr:helix-turn-helix transcriptional regulator [Nitrospirota bacterium]
MQTRTKDGHPIWLNVSSLSVPSRKRGVFWIAHLFRNINKQAKVYQLVQVLHTVLCAPSVPAVERCPDAPPDVPASLPLTEREREILRLLATGATSAHIADSLCLSSKTVRNHIQHILEKLGAHNRLQALAIAFPPGTHSSASLPR